jgi:hypothetical protein
MHQDRDTLVSVECEIGERCGWDDPRIAQIDRDIHLAEQARANALGLVKRTRAA